jgi:hypothetical protein
MANYVLNTAFKSEDQGDMTLIKLGNPIIADRKKVLTASPGTTSNSYQDSVLKALAKEAKDSRRTNKALLTIASGDSDYASM